MAPDASDDDKGDKTHIGTAPPPQVKPKPPSAPKAPTDPRAEHAEAAGAPPPSQPQPAAPGTAPGEHTSHGIAPPPKLPKPPAPGVRSAPPHHEPSSAAAAPSPVATAPPAPAAEEEDGTVILTRDRGPTATMQRLQPPGHSEVIRLDRTSYLLGRSHKCDVLLYSPMASREHARLTFRDGAWYVQPLGGKTVIADGVKVGDEQRLSHKTRLQLGGDELLYFDERAVAAVPEPRRVAPAASSRRPAILAAAGAAIAALALAAWWMFR